MAGSGSSPLPVPEPARGLSLRPPDHGRPSLQPMLMMPRMPAEALFEARSTRRSPRHAWKTDVHVETRLRLKPEARIEA